MFVPAVASLRVWGGQGLWNSQTLQMDQGLGWAGMLEFPNPAGRPGFRMDKDARIPGPYR